MEPNDKMIIDDDFLVQDIEDIGKGTINIIRKYPIPQEDQNQLDLDDEDINNNNSNNNILHQEEDINENININNNNQILIDDEPQQKIINHKKEKNNLMRFPLAKIKNTIKLDDDIKLCQKNVYFVIGKMTELFLQEMAKNSHQICKMSKRKTLNIDDINTAIKGKDKYSFIDMESIFHIDVIGTSPTKERQGKKNINQSTFTPESNALVPSPSIAHPNLKKSKSEKSNDQKQTKAKTAQKKIDSIQNRKIDQMFSK